MKAKTLTVAVGMVLVANMGFVNADADMESARAVKKGMTWGKYFHDSLNGIDRVGCHAGGVSCDPYQGDTSCKKKLPILCIKNDGSPRPNYDVPPTGGAMPDPYYSGWVEGHIALTLPVKGKKLRTVTIADATCAAAFGEGYRMAEFHDGKWVKDMDLWSFYGSTINSNTESPWPSSGLRTGGWRFYAYGNIDDQEGLRFWVRINDQPANCWD
jgi:hypothetical protein